MSVLKHVIRGAVVAALAVFVEPMLAQPAPRGDSAIAFTGEVRVRGEHDRPGSGVGGDGVTMLRTRLGADARPGSGVRMFVQLQDSRVFGEHGSTMAGSASQFDLHQGFVELAGNWQSHAVAMRAGRQEISIGNERLVGAAGWTATGRSFDALRVDLAPVGSAWRMMAFGATIDERGRRAASTDTVRGDETFAALSLTRGTLEALLIHDRGARFRGNHDVKRTTAYARYRTPAVATIALDVEGGYQFGTQDRTGIVAGAVPMQQDIGAWMVGARLVRDATTALPATLMAGVDWLSGDDDAADGSYRAFNTLQATNHKWYGTMDLFLDPAARTRDRGLVDALVSGSVKLSPRAAVRVDAHHFWTATNVPTAPLPGAGEPVSSRALGWEGDLTVPLQLSTAAGVELGYSVFRPGAGARELGLGREGSLRQWGYAQLRVGF